MTFSRKVALGLRKAIPCKRVGMTVVGLEVPHAHVHLIPLNSIEDISFNKKVKLTDQDFRELVKKIRDCF